MAKGGARQGAGRKPSAIEQNVKDAIKVALDENPGALSAIWGAVIKNAKQGSDKHTKLLFEYYYGKPKENLEEPHEMTINVVRKH